MLGYRWFAVALLLVACSEPSDDLPPLGRYIFTFDTQRFDAVGAFVLTAASEDQLDGTWDAPTLEPALHLGGWNNDAWVLGGTNATAAGIIAMRVQADEDTGLRCMSGRFNDGDVSQGAICTIAHE